MRETQSAKEYCLQHVQEHDLDRYYCCLFAPAAKRDDLFAVLAFNQEVTKTRAVVSEPMLGEIRLQWWREALEEVAANKPRAHPVVERLAATDGVEHILPFLNQIVDAWSDDLQPSGTAGVDYLETLAGVTGGALHQALLLILSPDAATDHLAAAKHAGAAWSLLASVRGLEAEIKNGAMPELEGLSGDAMKNQMQQVVKNLGTKVANHLDAFNEAATGFRSPVLAVAALSGLHLRVLAKAGYAPDRYFAKQPGNLASLWTVLRYNLTG